MLIANCQINAVTAESYTLSVLDISLTPQHPTRLTSFWTLLRWTWYWNLVPQAALGSSSHCCWTRALLDALGVHASRWDFTTPCPWPHIFYIIGVTHKLVWMLSQSQRTSPGLTGLKSSSNSVLPSACITRPTTDFRPPINLS